MIMNKGYVRTYRGDWLNLDMVHSFYVTGGTSLKYYTVCVTTSGEHRLTTTFDTEEEAQIYLDAMMGINI